MSGNPRPPETAAALLRLAIILFVFPIVVVYALPTMETVRQFYAGNRSSWFNFWAIAVTLEWLTLSVVIATLHEKRASLEAVGFPTRLSRRDAIIASSILLVTLGIAVGGAGGPQSFLRQLPVGLQMFIPPSDLDSRLFWVFVALTAAICEETLWRGVAITEVRARTGSTLLAVLISSLSFVFFHGGFQQGVMIIAYRLVISLILSAVYIRAGDLRSVIVIHFVMDAAALTAIQID